MNKLLFVVFLAWLLAIALFARDAKGGLQEDGGRGDAYLQYLQQFVVQPAVSVNIWRRPIIAKPKIDPVIRAQVLGIIVDAGYSPYIADKVLNCESGWQPSATSPKNPNGSVDRGLWQLNSVHRVPLEEVYDPIKSTYHAVNLLRSDRSWEHWTCFKKLFGSIQADSIP